MLDCFVKGTSFAIDDRLFTNLPGIRVARKREMVVGRVNMRIRRVLRYIKVV